jgi:hypothetical protein
MAGGQRREVSARPPHTREVEDPVDTQARSHGSMTERLVRVRIGIDTGGTFTDVVAMDETTGEIFTTKTPSVPEDPSLAVLKGLQKILGLAGMPAGAVTAVSHGTTVATNALLEEQFAALALVTTEGFRHVLRWLFSAIMHAADRRSAS